MDAHVRNRLVIFGCGYVGSAVARDALNRGWHVTALTRNAAKASVLREGGIEVVVADLASPSWYEQVPNSPQLVLNCVSSGGGGIDGYRRSYLEGMASILAWSQLGREPIGTFVYTSSTSVYGQGGGVVLDESASTETSGERGQLLTETEAALQTAQGVCRRWFVLRLAGIYGPERNYFVDQVRLGQVSGMGEQHLNLIHRDDIVGAIWACFGAPPAIANEVFNVADDGAATRAEIASWLAGRFGVPGPQFTGEPAGGRQRVTPDRIIGNTKLKARLGWQLRHPTFREGYAKLLSR